MSRQREIESLQQARRTVRNTGFHRLRVDTSGAPFPPSDEYQLLMSFRFQGDESRRNDGEIEIPLRKLGNASGTECWWFRGDVSHQICGTVQISKCDEYLVLSTRVSHEECKDMRKAARETYQRLFKVLDEHPGFKFVRIWNFLDGINDGVKDLERYRQFSVGRAEAFKGWHITDELSPTGTAIGTPVGSGLQIIGLASTRELEPVENPEQISAFNYPRKYGPRSPKFSRSGMVSAPCSLLFLISGTAAVVGHESARPFETNSQVRTTVRNLNALTSAVAARFQTPVDRLLNSSTHLRVYIRDSSDYEKVRDFLLSALPVPESQIIFLEGDICRRELMVEVEACTVIGHDAQR